jgi:hypothetical protein
MFARALQKSSTRITTLQFTKPLFNEPIIRMASSMRPQRRFAPLGQPATEGAPQLQGIVFDMDGTLCKYPFSISENKKWWIDTRNKERDKKKVHDTPLIHQKTHFHPSPMPLFLRTKHPYDLPHHPKRKKKNGHPPTLSVRT